MANRSTYLQGWSVEQLLNIEPDEFFNMSPTWQVEAVSRLSSAGNKRLKRIAAAGLEEYSPAYKDILQEGKFSVKGKDEKALYQEFKRLSRFFRRSTSTTKGARQFQKEVNRIFEETKGGKSEDFNIYTSSDMFINLVNFAREILPDATTSKLYATIKDKAAQIAERKAAWTSDDATYAMNEFKEYLEQLYRKQQNDVDSFKKYAAAAVKLLGL